MTIGTEVRDALSRSGPLRDAGVQFRLHKVTLYQSIYGGDGQLLVSPARLRHPRHTRARLPPPRRGRGQRNDHRLS